MAAWKEKTKAQTIENLKNTVDIGFMKGTLAVIVAIYVFFALALIWPARNDPGYWMCLGWTALLVFAPFGIYCGLRLYRIFRKADSYIFCLAKLSQPHNYNGGRIMYFTVVVEDLEGRKFPANTSAVFRTSGFVPPLLEEYVNRTVTIGYNEETEVVVVIG